MIGNSRGLFALGKNQPGARSKGVSRAVPRLLLVPLVCAAVLAMGVSRTWAAAAAVQVPYTDSYVLQLVSNINHDDGSQDQVYVGAGTGTYVGNLTVVITVHIVPLPSFAIRLVRPRSTSQARWQSPPPTAINS
jgi:hypothetical protein